jgi:hypothetical protein
MDHGMRLTDADCSYHDLTEFGEILISYDSNGVCVEISGFEFKEVSSCRQNVAKALAWARDVLTNELEATKMVPGGHIRSVDG